jgi:hypothetical protein
MALSIGYHGNKKEAPGGAPTAKMRAGRAVLSRRFALARNNMIVG